MNIGHIEIITKNPSPRSALGLSHMDCPRRPLTPYSTANQSPSFLFNKFFKLIVDTITDSPSAPLTHLHPAPAPSLWPPPSVTF